VNGYSRSRIPFYWYTYDFMVASMTLHGRLMDWTLFALYTRPIPANAGGPAFPTGAEEGLAFYARTTSSDPR